MINIEKALKNKRLMLALTGLNPDEFLNLISTFSQVYHSEKINQHKINAKQRKIGGGRKSFLKTNEQKLFYILFYFKCYPTYDLLSLIFDCNRSNACRRQFELNQILEKTLNKKLVLPKRKITSLDEFLSVFPEVKDIFIDATERPIQRPKDKEKQKLNYSGKKKRHTRKNLVITDKKKKVGFLSRTVEGKKHDFQLLKDEEIFDSISKKTKIHVDLGFQGIEKEYPEHNFSIPKKKAKNQELDLLDKEKNKEKSGIRILVENALAGVKRLRITSDVFRNKKENFDDKAILLACGIWNYHLVSSQC